MGGKRLVKTAAVLLSGFVVLLLAARPALARTGIVLHNFAGQPADGSNPDANLIFDAEGNLYGTTSGGGGRNFGTVFEIGSDGTEKVVYSFGSHSGDGIGPEGGLIMDAEGNLYGTTYAGDQIETGYGTVFEITPAGKEKLLHKFSERGNGGCLPEAGLVFDLEGNLYGTTTQCGRGGDGTVFEITTAGKFKVLYSFGSQPGDGSFPQSVLVLDREGNLYGTTYYGGISGSGTVFEITTVGAEKVLHSFGSESGDGAFPAAGLVFDTEGDLYGTTSVGGANNLGAVFKITSAGAYEVQYSFGGQSGIVPLASLIFDNKGNLYGTASQGNVHGGGTAFEITPEGKEIVLYVFGSQAGDGIEPEASLVFDKKGNLYGTTWEGGATGNGTVFELER
jgi:uncharacterized repeat protein (TIGR03803 family)